VLALQLVLQVIFSHEITHFDLESNRFRIVVDFVYYHVEIRHN